MAATSPKKNALRCTILITLCTSHELSYALPLDASKATANRSMVAASNYVAPLVHRPCRATARRSPPTPSPHPATPQPPGPRVAPPSPLHTHTPTRNPSAAAANPSVGAPPSSHLRAPPPAPTPSLTTPPHVAPRHATWRAVSAVRPEKMMPRPRTPEPWPHPRAGTENSRHLLRPIPRA